MKEKAKSASRRRKFPIPHYVCTGGCNFVANKPGKCRTSGCWRHRNPLTKCRCKNGKHLAIFKMYNPQLLKK